MFHTLVCIRFSFILWSVPVPSNECHKGYFCFVLLYVFKETLWPLLQRLWSVIYRWNRYKPSAPWKRINIAARSPASHLPLKIPKDITAPLPPIPNSLMCLEPSTCTPSAVASQRLGLPGGTVGDKGHLDFSFMGPGGSKVMSRAVPRSGCPHVLPCLAHMRALVALASPVGLSIPMSPEASEEQ